MIALKYVGIDLKPGSRPSVSNVTSTDVRLATILGTVTSLVNVMNSVQKPGRICLPTLLNETAETGALRV